MNRFKGILDTNKTKRGFKRSDIISVEIEGGNKTYHHISKGGYGEVTDRDGNIILKSVLEGSWFSRIVGTADIVFYQNSHEVLRVMLQTKGKKSRIKYRDNIYDYEVLKRKYEDEFSTKDFNIKLDHKEHRILFTYNESYLFECIACAIDIWRMYWDFS